MNCEQQQAEKRVLRLVADLRATVQTYPQTSEDEPGGLCRPEDGLMSNAADELESLARDFNILSDVYAEANSQLELAQKDAQDAERYRWLCEKLGETELPTLIERITRGYVADYKPSIDAAIDAAACGRPRMPS